MLSGPSRLHRAAISSGLVGRSRASCALEQSRVRRAVHGAAQDEACADGEIGADGDVQSGGRRRGGDGSRRAGCADVDRAHAVDQAVVGLGGERHGRRRGRRARPSPRGLRVDPVRDESATARPARLTRSSGASRRHLVAIGRSASTPIDQLADLVRGRSSRTHAAAQPLVKETATARLRPPPGAVDTSGAERHRGADVPPRSESSRRAFSYRPCRRTGRSASRAHPREHGSTLRSAARLRVVPADAGATEAVQSDGRPVTREGGHHGPAVPRSAAGATVRGEQLVDRIEDAGVLLALFSASRSPSRSCCSSSCSRPRRAPARRSPARGPRRGPRRPRCRS